jgi:hypothetical protein
MRLVVVLHHELDADPAAGLVTELNLEGFTVAARAAGADCSDAMALVPVWSVRTVDDPRMIGAAAAAAARRALTGVRIDRLSPPDPVAHVEIADLRGWSGDCNDPEFDNLVQAIRAIWSRKEFVRATEAQAMFRILGRARALRRSGEAVKRLAKPAAARARNAAKLAERGVPGHGRAARDDLSFAGKLDAAGEPLLGVMTGPFGRYEGELKGWVRHGHGATMFGDGVTHYQRLEEDTALGPACLMKNGLASYCDYGPGGPPRLINNNWRGGSQMGSSRLILHGWGAVRHAGKVVRGRYHYGVHIRAPANDAKANRSVRMGARADAHDVFVSYTRVDEALSGRLVRELMAEGFTVWWDQLIEAGSGWEDELSSSLARAHAVLLLWNANAARSRWVIEEARRASGSRKLFVVRTDDAPLPEGLVVEAGFDVGQWDGLSRHDGWTALVDRVTERRTGGRRSERLKLMANAVREARRIGALADTAYVSGKGVAEAAREARDQAIEAARNGALSSHLAVIRTEQGDTFAGEVVPSVGTPLLGSLRGGSGEDEIEYLGMFAGGQVTGSGSMRMFGYATTSYGSFREKDARGPVMFEQDSGSRLGTYAWNDAHMHRLGVLFHANGSRYEGGLRRWTYDGLGRLIDGDGVTVQAGRWVFNELVEPDRDAVRAFNARRLKID